MTDETKKAAIAALAPEMDDHPAYEAIAAAVDGTADDLTREIVESHAEVCRTCAAELADLRAFAESPRKSRVPFWLAAAAAAAAIAMLVFYAADRRRGLPPSPVPQASTALSPVPTPPARYARPEWQRLVDDALRTGHVGIPPELHSLASRDVFRGNATNGSAATLFPAATVVVDRRPRFTWSGVTAGDYQVRVYRGQTEVARSSRQRETSWQCPRELRRGELYRWQIEARRSGRSFIIPQPPAPPALFRVLGESESAELSAAIREHPNDDLLLGLLHARAGVLDRARDHLARYASQAKTPIAQKLLHEIHP